MLEFNPSKGEGWLISSAFRAGLSLSFSKIFSGCLEPGGSKTKTGLMGLGAVIMLVVLMARGYFLGAVGIGMGLIIYYYKNSERPLEGASWADRVGDYLAIGEVFPLLEAAAAAAPPILPENMF